MAKSVKRLVKKICKTTACEKENRRCINLVHNDMPGRTVCVAGSFNNWQPDKKMSDKNGDGVYRCQLRLAPGEYQYKLVIDGQWRLDEENPNLIPNEYGSCNNILVVEKAGK